MTRNHLHVLLFMALSAVGCRSQPVDTNEERGLIFTGTSQYGDAVQMWYQKAMPVYESNYSKEIYFLKYGNPYIHFVSVDVDYKQKIAYAYDKHYKTIAWMEFSSNLSGPRNLSNVHVGVSGGTVQVALDWLSHTLYWTDSTYHWILAAPAKRGKINKNIFKIIVDTNLDYPDGVTVDPLEGYLFWSDSGDNEKIERSDLRGASRRTLVTSGLATPMSLEADHSSKRVFWVDTYAETIESVTYDGKDRKIIRRIPSSILTDLAIYRDVLVVTNVYSGGVMFLNKTSGKKLEEVLTVPRQTPFGVSAYYQEKQPIPFDHCSPLNCDQLCFTTQGGAVCDCGEGYTLNATSNKCVETTGSFHKTLVLTNASHVCLLDARFAADMNQECTFIFAFPTGIILIDLDMTKRLLYFTDKGNSIRRRPIDMPFEDSATDTIVQHTAGVTGLAFDWTGANLYWCKSNGDLYILSTETRSIKSIQNIGPDASNLIVLPHDRALVWISGLHINSMSVDGGTVATIASQTNVISITSLTADYDTKTLYWIANTTRGSMLQAAHFDGSSVDERDLPTIDKSSYLLTKYKGYFMWLSNTSDARNSVFASSQGKTSSNTSLNISATNVRMLDTGLQMEQTDVCAHMNGGCEHICVVYHLGNGTASKKCECSQGFELAADDTNCVGGEPTNDEFLIVFDETFEALKQIDLTGNDVIALPIDDVGIVTAVAFNPKTNKTVWSELYEQALFAAFLDGSLNNEVGSIDSGTIHSLFLDQTTGNMYFTAYTFDYDVRNQKVGLITPGGHEIPLVTDFSDHFLTHIAVDPRNGKMYFGVISKTAYLAYYTSYKLSANTSTDSYIARADMNGDHLEKLVTSYNGMSLRTPYGIAIDYTNDKLYWSDSTHNIIVQCSLAGTACSTLVDLSAETANVMDLATDGAWVYYLETSLDSVVAWNLKDNSTRMFGSNLGRLSSLVFYSRASNNRQPENTACAAHGGKGDCNVVCIPTNSNDMGRACACEEGQYLLEDGRTCDNLYQCSAVIEQTESVVITFVNCKGYQGDRCVYMCPLGYIRSNDSVTELECLSDGWQSQTDILCILVPTATEKQVIVSTGASNTATVVIIVFLVLVIAALAAVLAFMVIRIRRRHGGTYAAFFNGGSSNVAIGNSAVMSATPPVGVRMSDDPEYAGTPDRVQFEPIPTNIGQQDSGISNPLYENTIGYGIDLSVTNSDVTSGQNQVT